MIDTMVKSGSIKAFNRYAALLQDRGFAAEQMPDTPSHGDHLVWMCNHCLKRITANDPTFPEDKYSRWLGYIQGVMDVKDYLSVREERDVTRPWFTGAA